MKSKLVLATLALAAAGMALADPPKPLHVVETVTVKSTPDAVWAAVKDFDSLNKWHPGFSADELVSGTNGKVGSVRKLTVKDGPSFTERLTAYDDAGHSYRYRIIESPLPITDYSSKISVKPGKKDGTTEVIWSGTFKRKNASDNPPDAESDAGALKLVKGVYRGGLDNLKKTFGG
jgi:mxaD protein